GESTHRQRSLRRQSGAGPSYACQVPAPAVPSTGSGERPEGRREAGLSGVLSDLSVGVAGHAWSGLHHDVPAVEGHAAIRAQLKLLLLVAFVFAFFSSLISLDLPCRLRWTLGRRLPFGSRLALG